MIFALTYTAFIIVGLMLVARFNMKIDAPGFVLPKEDIEEIRNKEITLQQKLGCVVMIAFFCSNDGSNLYAKRIYSD